jgi:hypothetical protein
MSMHLTAGFLERLAKALKDLERLSEGVDVRSFTLEGHHVVVSRSTDYRDGTTLFVEEITDQRPPAPHPLLGGHKPGMRARGGVEE